MMKLVAFVAIFAAVNAQRIRDEFGDVEPAKKPVAKCKEESWTQWFNLDNAGTGCDHESLAQVQALSPVKVCSNPTAMDVELAQPQFHPYAWNINIGYNYLSCCCNNQILGGMCWICHDYKVRFCCDTPVIGECANTKETTATWTPFYDIDTPFVPPTPLNDDETLMSFGGKYKVCKKPSALDARLLNGDPYYMGANTFTKLSPAEGLLCESFSQECRDYKVRFCCHYPKTIGTVDAIHNVHSYNTGVPGG